LLLEVLGDWEEDNHNNPVVAMHLKGIRRILERLEQLRLADPQGNKRLALRPAAKLENYFILFEVEAWEAYPRDLFLLRHIVGSIYLIMAEWKLTKLEAELLAALRGE
jgi:hypothetical protein